MRSPGLSLVSIALGVLFLSGCGATQPLAPAISLGNAVALRQRGQVQYVSDYYNSELVEYDYPKGTSPIGEMTGGAAGGMCTIGARTFWVVGYSDVLEYRVGRKHPIAELDASGNGCSVDPTTGDLAVFGFSQVIIFKHARGSGKTVTLPIYKVYFGGYDGNGNLFLDGFSSGSHASVAKLPKGGSSFKMVTLSNSIDFPGQVQWDGSYITIEDQQTSNVYGYTCKGTSCTLKRTVSLLGASDCAETSIAKGYIFCADAGNNNVEVYNYPAGGTAAATLGGNLNLPLGVISLSAQ